MKEYLRLLEDVLISGEEKENRTGINTISCFGKRLEIDLQLGFPLLTTKKMNYYAIFGELIWMLSGSTNIGYLKEKNIHIWDAWADTNGNVGKLYGYQWRHWTDKNGKKYDQIKEVIYQLKNNNISRRIILSTWNVGDLEEMNLPPCHILAQFYIRGGGFLDCSVYQRSADMFLGLPFDIASYSALTSVFAAICGYKPGRIIYNIGDAHIYVNHIEAVKQQLSRPCYALPQLKLPINIDIDKLEIKDFQILNYNYWPAIKASVAI